MHEMTLEGQLLIAMPNMRDERFARSVVYMCAHSSEGAMGLIINKHVDQLTFGELLDQIDIFPAEEAAAGVPSEIAARPVHNGGPVEVGRGFVLHSLDYEADESTLKIAENIALTATTDILKAMARDKGPRNALLALGYAGWAPGQLENELAANGWLTCDGDPDIVFAAELEGKYDSALAKLGVDPSHLVATAGRA